MSNKPHIIILEQFDWTSTDGKTSITFRITEMLGAIAAGQLKTDLITSPLDANFARQWLIKRDLNEYYCRNMSLRRLDQPVLGVWMPDKTVLLIDGSHRYMARYYSGQTTVDYHLVALADWQSYATISGQWEQN